MKKNLPPKEKAEGRVKRAQKDIKNLIQQIHMVARQLLEEIDDGQWSEIKTQEARRLQLWSTQLIEATTIHDNVKWIFDDPGE